MSGTGKFRRLTESLGVQYLYKLAGLSRLAFTQQAYYPDTSTYAIVTPTIPLDAKTPVIGQFWFWNNDTNAYQLQEYRGGMDIFIPDNIIIDSITLHIFSGPVYSSKTTSGGVASTPEYMQPNALKLFLSTVEDAVPFTYMPLAADFLTDPIIQKPVNDPTEITSDVLGSAWNPDDGPFVRSVTADLTNLFQPGDHKYLEIREDTGSSTDASGGTIMAYVVLNGFIA